MSCARVCRRRRHRRRRHDDARRCSRERRVPGRARSCRSPPSARPAASCRRPHRASRCDDDDDPGLRHRAVLGRGRRLPGVGPAVRRRRRHGDRQLLGVPARPGYPAGRLRGQPARARGLPRPDRQPQLLDDAADGRAGADPSGGRNRAAGRRHLPVGLRHRQGGDRRARRAGARLAARDRDARRPRSIPSRSRSTSSAPRARSPTATTTPTRSAR